MATNQERSQLIDWMMAGVRKADGAVNGNGRIHSYVGGAAFPITGATNASPIVITTATAHRLREGARVYVAGLGGNTAANDQFWTVSLVTAPTSTISAASNAQPIVISTTAVHKLASGDIVAISGVVGNTAANGTWTVTVTDATHFSLNSSSGNGPYLSGGGVKVANKFSLTGSSGNGTYTSGGTVLPTQKLYQQRDAGTDWGSNSVVTLDANGRPTSPVFAKGLYRFDVYDSTPSFLYTLDNADYGSDYVLNVKDFGATGDGQLNGTVWTGPDDTAAINEAIAAGLAYTAARPWVKARVYFPPGAYLISDSLQATLVSGGTLATGGVYDAVCIELFGDHRAFPVGVSALYQRAAYIVQQSNSVPALCIQNARGVSIKNLGFIGQNIFPSFTYDDLIDDSLYVNRGCRDEVNSPYAAIAIDPYKDNRPAKPSSIVGAAHPASPIQITTSAAHDLETGDRVNIVAVLGNTAANGTWTITKVDNTKFTLNGSTSNGSYTSGGAVYPLPPTTYGYPEQSEHYVNGNASSAITVEGCSFEQFVVGVVIAPTASGGNTENIYLRDVGFQRHRVAVAVCQNQARGVVLENVAAADQQFFVTTRIYGEGGPYFSGAPPFIHKASIGGTKYLFNIYLSAQNFHVHGMYVESSLSIGYIGASKTAAGNLGATFAGCTFSFWNRAGKAIDFHLFNYAPTEFRGSSFASGDAAQPIVFYNQAPLTFADSAFPSFLAPAGTFPIAFQNPEWVKFENSRMFDVTLNAGVFTLHDSYEITGPTALRPPPAAAVARLFR